jgi:hypothetical protein
MLTSQMVHLREVVFFGDPLISFSQSKLTIDFEPAIIYAHPCPNTSLLKFTTVLGFTEPSLRIVKDGVLGGGGHRA